MTEDVGLWGIYDTVDDCWLGDDGGPLLFELEHIARVAAQVIETQVFGTDLGCRFSHRPFTPAVYQKRDEVPLRMGPLEAIQQLEGEEVITPTEESVQ